MIDDSGVTPQVTPSSGDPQQDKPSSGEPLNPFDPKNLRISQDFESKIGVKKVLNTVPVRKPSKQDFIRVHPHEDYRLDAAIIELKDEGESYLLDPTLAGQLTTEFVVKRLYLAINRQGIASIWPVKIESDDGSLDTWNRSAHEAAAMAMNDWISVRANMHLGAYDIFRAISPFEEPEWPAVPFAKLLELAFRGRYIRTWDHPVLRRLRGES